jgi:hypothetical protein
MHREKRERRERERDVEGERIVVNSNHFFIQE